MMEEDPFSERTPGLQFVWWETNAGEEAGTRNTHTRKRFLNIVLETGYDIFDLQNALLDLQTNEATRKRLERFLRKEMRRIAQVYGDKVRGIVETTRAFRMRRMTGLGGQPKPVSQWSTQRYGHFMAATPNQAC
jgi:hypothetical protein